MLCMRQNQCPYGPSRLYHLKHWRISEFLTKKSYEADGSYAWWRELGKAKFLISYNTFSGRESPLESAKQEGDGMSVVTFAFAIISFSCYIE